MIYVAAILAFIVGFAVGSSVKRRPEQDPLVIVPPGTRCIYGSGGMHPCEREAIFRMTLETFGSRDLCDSHAIEYQNGYGWKYARQPKRRSAP